MDRIIKAARASGSLNLSNRSLRYNRSTLILNLNLLVILIPNASLIRFVPDEVYKSVNAVGEDEKWWEASLFSSWIWIPMQFWTRLMWIFTWFQAVELQKLILAHNEIELLKDELRNLPMLTVLNVSHNKLSQLLAAIGEWALFCNCRLVVLLILRLRFVEMLICCGRLGMLKSLDVSFNLLVELPEEIGSATALVKYVFRSFRYRNLVNEAG